MSTQSTKDSQTKAFDEALEAFTTAMRSCIKLQEEAAQTSARVLGDLGSPQSAQQRTQDMVKDAVPAMRKSVEDAMKTVDQTARTSLDLLEKAMCTSQPTSIAESQQKTRELWESMLTTARTNTNAMVQMNARAIEMWAGVARKAAPSASTKK